MSLKCVCITDSYEEREAESEHQSPKPPAEGTDSGPRITDDKSTRPKPYTEIV